MPFINQWFHRYFDRIFRNPQQIQSSHHNTVEIIGKIGFFTKALIYATIGGLTVDSALSSKVHNESPQGVFILLGSMPNGTGIILLILLLVGVTIYATWRFWEGLYGQGYDPRFSRKKNFFRYRVSPLVSGLVYVLYAIYIIYLFTVDRPEPGSSVQQETSSCFPICWRYSTIGNIGLALLAISFTIATITQLIPALTGNFKNEMDFNKFKGKSRTFVYIFFPCGHIGFFGRALLFFLICYLFWKILLGDDINLDPAHSTVSQAINSIKDTVWGRIIMATLGISLLVYSLFALMCIVYKIFPTPPPSQNTSLPISISLSNLPNNNTISS